MVEPITNRSPAELNDEVAVEPKYAGPSEEKRVVEAEDIDVCPVKDGAPLTDRAPVTVVADRVVVPPVRVVKLPPVAETLMPLSNMLLRMSPLRTMTSDMS